MKKRQDHCDVPECEKRHNSHGLCSMHGSRMARYGSVNPAGLKARGLSREERFMASGEKTDTCWLWTGYKIPEGYGRFRTGHTMRPSHQVSYELHVGPIPDGLELDHLCRVRACVNPEHLDPVSHAVNNLRARAMQPLARKKALFDAAHILAECVAAGGSIATAEQLVRTAAEDVVVADDALGAAAIYEARLAILNLQDGDDMEALARTACAREWIRLAKSDPAPALV